MEGLQFSEKTTINECEENSRASTARPLRMCPRSYTFVSHPSEGASPRRAPHPLSPDLPRSPPSPFPTPFPRPPARVPRDGAGPWRRKRVGPSRRGYRPTTIRSSSLVSPPAPEDNNNNNNNIISNNNKHEYSIDDKPFKL